MSIKKLFALITVIAVMLCCFVSCDGPTADTSKPDASKPTEYSVADNSDTDVSKDDVSTADDTSTTDDTSKTDDTSDDTSSTEDTSSDDTSGSTAQLKDFSSSGTFTTLYDKTCRFGLDYTVKSAGDGKAELEVKVFLDSYDVSIGPRPNMGKIIINGENHTFSTDRLEHTDGERVKAELTAFKTTLDRDEKLDIAIDVSWIYNGIYGETAVKDMTAGGTVTVTADGTVTSVNK